MDMQKIGGLLRTLRRERGLTQEQLAEVLGVAGRTVSRWETAVNLPDLSILIQLSEFYNVDIKELLDGERKEKPMDSDLKETLEKVADYGDAEKRQIARIGRTAFSIMFFACAAAILVQLLLLGNWRYTIGETAVLLAGGVAALVMTAHGGLWEAASGRGRTPLGDGILSLAVAAPFTVFFALATRRLSVAPSRAAAFIAGFYALVALAGFAALRAFAAWSKGRKAKIHRE